MSDWIPKDEVRHYLIRIKTAVSEGRYRFEDRKKNIDSMAKTGILPKHVPQIIMQLTYLDYFNGPEPEENEKFPPGDYMSFGHNINGREFYIKIKIEQKENQDFCVCIGFHDPIKPIIYAFKK